MQIVRTIFWVVLAIALVLFAVANWQPVEVRIGNGLVLDTKLPVLVVGAFLLGLLPMWLVHRIVVWRLRRRITQILAAQPHAAAYPAAEPEGTIYAERPLAS